MLLYNVQSIKKSTNQDPSFSSPNKNKELLLVNFLMHCAMYKSTCAWLFPRKESGHTMTGTACRVQQRRFDFDEVFPARITARTI
ncbi:hypothetical protein PUN28_001025 [Cardiocondyla obscurior]|uniref:Uncharacterized protein n=1 Tax=Cardiocondyla obscurior TaxID=286306 RepID=A0AAW2H2Z1_9HYME